MSTINFNEIDCKQSINKENKIINFNGSEIRVLNHLSAYDTYDLVMVTLQKAFEEEHNIYNPIKLNVYFDLHLVYMYTNIIFSAEDRANEVDLYDTLNECGLIALVREAIGQEELNRVEILMQKTMTTLINYSLSVGGVLSNLSMFLGNKVQEWLEVFKNLNPESVNAMKEKINNLGMSLQASNIK